MFNPGNYSKENLGKIKKVIKIILDEIEIQGIAGHTGNKIPLNTFLKEGFIYEDIIGILNLFKTKEDLPLKIGNEEIKRMVKPASYIFESERKYAEAKNKEELLSKLKISEEDLSKYILLRLNNANVIEKLKEINKQIEEENGKSKTTNDDAQLKFNNGLQSFIDPPALRLLLNGDRLCIAGSVIENKTIELNRIRGGSGSLIEPLLKVCKNHPYTFKTITLNDLQSKTDMQSKSLEASTKNIPLFKSYLSNIGLKDELRKLFFANSPEGLGFKFRIMVSPEEWNKLPTKIKQNVVNTINKKALSKD